ncbi:MAG: hsaB 3 [Conexibacter sp.]|nr:hsaB 3 [Conexibacter sp.]
MSEVIEPAVFRRVLGHFPTGVAVVTAIDEDGVPAGLAVGSFSSVSLDPPLVSFAATRTSSSFAGIRTASSFAVNILSSSQEDLCRRFATPGIDKFAGIDWHPGLTGAPLLEGVVAWVDCEFEAVHEAGDHYIALGRVLALEAPSQAEPLVFLRGGYGRFDDGTPPPARADAAVLEQLRLVDLVRDEMEQLAAHTGLESIAVGRADGDLVLLGRAGRTTGEALGAHVGQRLPFVPPLGTLFVAWEDEPTLRAWIDRHPASANAEPALRRMSALVQQRGWSLVLSSERQSALERAIARVARRPLEASHARSVHQAALDVLPSSQAHEPLLTEDDQLLDVSHLGAPVRDAQGRVLLELALTLFPNPVSADELEGYRSALLESAARATSAVAAAAL